MFLLHVNILLILPHISCFSRLLVFFLPSATAFDLSPLPSPCQALSALHVSFSVVSVPALPPLQHLWHFISRTLFFSAIPLCCVSLPPVYSPFHSLSLSLVLPLSPSSSDCFPDIDLHSSHTAEPPSALQWAHISLLPLHVWEYACWGKSISEFPICLSVSLQTERKTNSGLFFLFQMLISGNNVGHFSAAPCFLWSFVHFVGLETLRLQTAAHLRCNKPRDSSFHSLCPLSFAASSLWCTLGLYSRTTSWVFSFWGVPFIPPLSEWQLVKLSLSGWKFISYALVWSPQWWNEFLNFWWSAENPFVLKYLWKTFSDSTDLYRVFCLFHCFPGS